MTRDRVEIALVVVIVAIGLALVGSALHYTWLLFIPVPYWDQFDGVRYDTSAYTLSYLHSQHNEHRLLFPRLLYLLDLVAFDGRNIFLVAVTLALQGLHGLLLFLLARRAGALGRRWEIGLSAFAVGCVLAPVQIENFIWGFDVQFAMVVFFATGTFAALARCVEGGRGSWAWLAGAAASAAVATYSLASGLLAWPIALLLALWLRLPRRMLLTFAAAGVAVCWSFLSGWHPHPGHSDPVESLTALPRVLGYVAAYLGGPFAHLPAGLGLHLGAPEPFGALTLARVAGATGALTALGLGLLALTRRKAFRPSEGALLAAAAFPVGTASLTGLGRLRFPAEQALSSRYCTLTLVFWAALVLAIFSLTARATGRAGAGRRRAARVLPAILGAALLLAQTPAIGYFVERGARLSEASLAMVVGVGDQERLRELHPVPERIWPVAETLQRNRWSLFAQRWPHLLGQPLAGAFVVGDSTLCSGRIDGLEVIASPSRPGLRVVGRARDEVAGGPPALLVLVSADGRIVGFGRSSGATGDGERWHGYVAGAHVGPIRAYAVLAGGAACPASGWLETGGLDLVPAARVGPPIEPVEVSLEGGWTRDGQYPTWGAPPFASMVYGSWSGDDAHTGVLRAGPFPVGAEAVIGIPLVTGPDVSGQSLRVVAHDSGEVVARLDLPGPVSDGWLVWRVELPSPEGRYELVAEDAGRGWGQWMAVGLPRRVLAEGDGEGGSGSTHGP